MASETRETVLLRNAKADAVGVAIANGTLRIYEELSVPPTFEGTPGNLLVSIDLPAEFDPAVDGMIEADLMETVITESGDANWYRCYNDSDAFMLDGPVYISSDPDPPVGGLALTITALTADLTIVGSFTYTSPQQD